MLRKLNISISLVERLTWHCDARGFLSTLNHGTLSKSGYSWLLHCQGMYSFLTSLIMENKLNKFHRQVVMFLKVLTHTEISGWLQLYSLKHFL